MRRSKASIVELQARLTADGGRLALRRPVDKVQEVENRQAIRGQTEIRVALISWKSRNNLKIRLWPPSTAYFGSWLDLTMSRAVRPSNCAMFMSAPPSIRARTQPSWPWARWRAGGMSKLDQGMNVTGMKTRCHACPLRPYLAHGAYQRRCASNRITNVHISTVL
jgi:hypothetical protein